MDKPLKSVIHGQCDTRHIVTCTGVAPVVCCQSQMMCVVASVCWFAGIIAGFFTSYLYSLLLLLLFVWSALIMKFVFFDRLYNLICKAWYCHFLCESAVKLHPTHHPRSFFVDLLFIRCVCIAVAVFVRQRHKEGDVQWVCESWVGVVQQHGQWTVDSFTCRRQVSSFALRLLAVNVSYFIFCHYITADSVTCMCYHG